MKKKLVSIIVPLYNAERFIRYTIDSILKQTYSNFELIVINDGSTDNSLKVIENYKDTRIKILDFTNHGAPFCRNKGIENAKGEYIMFCDADDVLKEKAIENMFNEITSNDCDLVQCSYYEIDEYNKLINNSKYLLENKIFDLCKSSDLKYCMKLRPVPGNKLYKMSIIKDNNIYFSNVKIGQDLNFYLKYLLYSKKVKTIQNFYFNYRITKNSISRQPTEKILDIINSINEVEKFMSVNNIYNETFKNELYNIRVSNYYTQLGKYPFIKSEKLRKKIFYKFYNELCNIKKENYNYLSSNALNIINKVKFKKKFGLIFLNFPYINYYRITHKKMMG